MSEPTQKCTNSKGPSKTEKQIGKKEEREWETLGAPEWLLGLSQRRRRRESL